MLADVLKSFRKGPILNLSYLFCSCHEWMTKHGGKKKGGWRLTKRRRSVSAAPVGRPLKKRAASTSDFATDAELHNHPCGTKSLHLSPL